MTKALMINSSMAKFALGTVFALGTLAAFPTIAEATATTNEGATVEPGEVSPPSLVRRAPRLLADNVVVTPNGGNAPAPAPAAPASSTVVVPQAAPAAQAAPAGDQTTRNKNVHAEVSGPRNYMSTIALSAFMGAVTGALIGGAIYFLDDSDPEARNIAYWAAGGVLLGTGVGLTQVLVQESRVSSATAARLPADPAPTFRLALVNLRF